MKKIIIIFISVYILTGCESESVLWDDHFFVENKDAIMPVLVRGNPESGSIVLFLHGGPGGSASQAAFLPAFKDLENQYVMAYWDQRASGLSQGNPDESTYTVEQFTEDLDVVVAALQDRYPGMSVFLFGHSWGGALGSAYLSTSNYQEKISGFIIMNSGHNLEVGLPLSVDWVENYAEEQISAGKKKEYWTRVRDWCAAEPDMTVPDNYFKYVGYLQETDAYRHDNQPVNTGKVTMGDVLNSHMSLAAFFNGRYLAHNFNILELNLSDDMQRITIPCLVLWGKYDGVNTLEMGYDAYHSIGTPSENKEMVILENSAHEGYLEEPELFKASVASFLDRLN